MATIKSFMLENFKHFNAAAMVDAAQGGKTGIDLGGAKNLVGTFTHAELIYLDASFLETLPDVQLRSGFAEMLKHGLITMMTIAFLPLKKFTIMK